MKKGLILLAVAISITILVMGVFGCSAFPTGSSSNSSDLKYLGNISQQNSGIWVSGTGKITVTPDIAEISLGVETQSDNVAGAQQQAVGAMSAVIAALKSYNIADKDISTQYYNINPVYNYDKGTQTLTGYHVSNTISIKIRKIEDAGKIIDGVAVAGGDATRINSISFSVDNPEKYNEEVRKLAMADAETKAKQMASLGKVKLGKITYITESGGYIPPIIYRTDSAVKESMGVSTTPISAGETEISLTVQIIYSII
jgi:uncharacterized protein YggE